MPSILDLLMICSYVPICITDIDIITYAILFFCFAFWLTISVLLLTDLFSALGPTQYVSHYNTVMPIYKLTLRISHLLLA